MTASLAFQGAPFHTRLHLVAALPSHQRRPLHPPLLSHHPGHHHHHHGQVQRHQARGVPQRESISHCNLPQQKAPTQPGAANPTVFLPLGSLPPSPRRGHPCTCKHLQRPQERESPGPVLTDHVTSDSSLLTPRSPQQKNGRFRLGSWLPNLKLLSKGVLPETRYGKARLHRWQ